MKCFSWLRALCSPIVLLASACGNDVTPRRAPLHDPVEQVSADQEDDDAERRKHSDEEILPLESPAASGLHCPEGDRLDTRFQFCVQGEGSSAMARGYFSAAMVSECKRSASLSPEECAGTLWPLALARTLRGTGKCPQGTTFDDSVKSCAAGDDVFGPFTPAAVESCKQHGGGAPCETMRWHRSFLEPEKNTPQDDTPQPIIDPSPKPTWEERLFAWYSKPDNFRMVYEEALRYRSIPRYGGESTTRNSCVAFMATALRHVGFELSRETMVDGNYAWIYIPAFVPTLESRNFRRVSDASALKPGDIFFSSDGTPAEANHVMMFHSWISREEGTARVIDNQVNSPAEYIHIRHLRGGPSHLGRGGHSPYSFTLKSR